MKTLPALLLALTTVAVFAEEDVILTPPPLRIPRINGPHMYGIRPGNPFLYRIPCTGERPIKFGAKNLPTSLSLDPSSGLITGRNPERGEYLVTLTAENAAGRAERIFKIISGDALALTPPMGWNSWYIHYNRVTDKVMRDAADAMIASGMADAGYQYINVDDCWMNAPETSKFQTDPNRVGPLRDAAGNIQPNIYFPDMPALTGYIHSKGLKAGIYTSPGPSTCAGFCGSYQHEAQDAKQFADWGFDFLKYDWCTYRRIVEKTPDIAAMKKPYQLMGDLLKKQRRDIAFNLCQYGMGDVWKWGGEVGHCWRTTGDLGLELGSGLPGFYNIGLNNAKHWKHARPGAWNDPDYILIGWVGDAHGMSEGKLTNLTPNEQYSYMSMWSLMAAPLIFGGDMTKLDAFALNILCNSEVIEVDQDPLGKQAHIVRQTGSEFILIKDLEDGSKAVGLFNLSAGSIKLFVTRSDLGLAGKQRARDLWRQKDLGVFENEFSTTVPRHGVALIRLTATK